MAAGLVLAGGVGLSALLLGVHLRYDSDFLCCHHPDVAYATFVGAPLAAMVLAIAAIIDVARHPNRLRGLPLAILVLCLSVIHAVLGIGLISALKA